MHKHNILSVFYVDRESSALQTMFPVLFGILIAGFCLQILTVITIIKSDIEDYQLPCKIILTLFVCVLMVAVTVTHYLVKRGRYNKNETIEAINKIDIKDYYHPIDKN